MARQRNTMKYFTLSFAGKLDESISPAFLARGEAFTRMMNVRRNRDGELESRRSFVSKISKFISGNDDERVVKLWASKNGTLLGITTKAVYIYNSTQTRWAKLVDRTNQKLSTYSITQKEEDIKHLGITNIGDGDDNLNLLIIYSFKNRIFVKIFNTKQKRVLGKEQEIIVREIGARTIEGLAVDKKDNGFWLGILTDSGITIKSYELQIRSTEVIGGFEIGFRWHVAFQKEGSDINKANIEKMIFENGKVYYRIGGVVRSQPYDNPNDIPEPNKTIINPATNAQDFERKTLHDFRLWNEFVYKNERFKLIWSEQTGYFLINQNNKIIGHYFANNVPIRTSEPPRMEYYGSAVEKDNKVYIPVLFSGQIEVVAGGKFRFPLGCKLLEFDFESKIPPSIEQLGNQTFIGGPVINYFDNQDVSELGFAERPKIEKTEAEDYDKWAYSENVVREDPIANDDNTETPVPIYELPTSSELNTDDYDGFDSEIEKKNTPYTVEDVEFTAKAVNVNGAWKTTGTPEEVMKEAEKRDLRYGTNSDGTLVKKYGRLATLKYDDTEKAVVATFTGVPALVGSEGHPEGLLVNGIAPVLEFMYYVLSSGTLTAYHFTETNPFTAGTKYNIKIPSAEVLQTKDLDQALTPTDDKPLKINEVKLRQFKNQTITMRSRAAAPVIETGVSYGKLNHLDWQGAVSNPDVVRGELSIPANDGGTGVTNGNLVSRDLGTGINFNVSAVISSSVTRGPARPSFKDQFTRSIGSSFSQNNSTSVTATHFAYTGSGFNIYIVNIATGVVSNFQSPVYEGSRRVGINAIHLSSSALYLAGEGRNGELYAYKFSLTGSLQRTVYLGDEGSHGYSITSNSTHTFWMGLDTSGPRNRDDYWYIERFDLDLRNKTRERNSSVENNRTFLGANDTYLFTGSYDSSSIRRIPTNNFGSSGSSLSISRDTIAFNNNNIFTTSGNTLSRRSLSGTQIDSVALKRSSGYRFGLAGASDSILTIVSASSPTMQERYNLQVNLSVPGFGRNLTLVISAAKGSYANVDALESDFKSKVNELNFNSSSEGPAKLTVSGDLTTVDKLSKTTNYYLVYNLDAKYTSSSLLKTIVDSGNFNIEFVSPSGRSFLSDGRFLAPTILSASFNSNLENLKADDIKDNLLLVSSANQNQTNQFVLNEFSKSKGPTSGRHYYYRKTSANPLQINSSVVNFVEPPERLIFRYILVTLRPTADQVLTAHVYQYACRFKWLDENGLEFRSPLSPKIQIFTNTPIGLPGNQPTFDVNFLNLTNKKNGVTIEIYRTRDKRGTFLFLKEISNKPDFEGGKEIITDDVEDKDLGQVLDPNKYVVSGADNILTYRNRFVLYGFPEFKNRFRVSSKLRPFTNQGISFLRNRPALPGDSIEIRMSSDIIAIAQLDQALVIFCEDGVYFWVINENSVRQEEPVKITSLTNLRPVDSIAVSEVANGLFILTPLRGMWNLTRGQGVNFSGEGIQDFKGRLRDVGVRLQSAEEIKYITTDQANYPILCYDYRHHEWFVDSILNAVSQTVWQGKHLILKSDGTILTEDEDFKSDFNHVVQTGWLNFSAIQGLNRIREVSLLADFEELKSIALDIAIDFREELKERKMYKPSKPADSKEFEKKRTIFRFQITNQEVRGMRLRWTISAKSVKLISMFFKVDVKSVGAKDAKALGGSSGT